MQTAGNSYSYRRASDCTSAHWLASCKSESFEASRHTDPSKTMREASVQQSHCERGGTHEEDTCAAHLPVFNPSSNWKAVFMEQLRPQPQASVFWKNKYQWRGAAPSPCDCAAPSYGWRTLPSASWIENAQTLSEAHLPQLLQGNFTMGSIQCGLMIWGQVSVKGWGGVTSQPSNTGINLLGFTSMQICSMSTLGVTLSITQSPSTKPSLSYKVQRSPIQVPFKFALFSAADECRIKNFQVWASKRNLKLCWKAGYAWLQVQEAVEPASLLSSMPAMHTSSRLGLDSAGFSSWHFRVRFASFCWMAYKDFCCPWGQGMSPWRRPSAPHCRCSLLQQADGKDPMPVPLHVALSCTNPALEPLPCQLL